MADSVTNITPAQGGPEARYGAASQKKRGGKAEIVLISAGDYPNQDDMVSDIAQALEDGKSVIASLKETQPNMRNRVVDFSSGMVHILHGKTERINNEIYLFANNNVTVSKPEVSAQAPYRGERGYGDYDNTIY